MCGYIAHSESFQTVDDGYGPAWLSPRPRMKGRGPESGSRKSLLCAAAQCAIRVSVEPVVFLAVFAYALQGPLCTQYLFERMSRDVGYHGNRQSSCWNQSNDPLAEKVHILTAHWSLYINLGGFLFSLFSVTLFGPWSDSVGRRPVLIIPAVGLALQSAVYLLVMYQNLHVSYFLIGRMLSGITGDFSMVLAGCFAYVADISDQSSRTFRVAILEACVGTAGMFASIIGGHWSKAKGYINPFWLVFALNIATIIYVIFCVPESVTEKKKSRLLTSSHYKSLCQLFMLPGTNKQRGKLWLYSVTLFLVVAVHMGAKDLFVLYELGSPLCWGSELIGYGFAAEHMTYLSSLAGLRVLQYCLQVIWVAELGLVSNIAGLIMFAFATTTPMMFSGYGLRFLAMVTTPIVRSKLSKLVDKKEQEPPSRPSKEVLEEFESTTKAYHIHRSYSEGQCWSPLKLAQINGSGTLFASVASVESLASLVATGVFNSIYPTTLSFMRGFPFLFGGAVLLVPAVIIGLIELVEAHQEYLELAGNP